MAIHLTIADLDLSVRHLESALNVHHKQRVFDWAPKRCIDTRFVHKNIWKFRPTNEYVEKEIIPLLRKTKEAVMAMCFEDYSKDERKKLVVYTRNITLRIMNLSENYMHGKPSDFAPEDKLEEVEEQIWAEIALGRG